MVGVGLTASYLLAGQVGLPRFSAALLCLGVLLGLGALGTPDWLSQVLRQVPSRGKAGYHDTPARAFLLTGALGALAFGAWGALR